MKFKVLLLTSYLCLSFCSAYKILIVFPIPGVSHSILGKGYVNLLLKAGHEVTYITPIIIKNPPPKLRQIDVSDNFNSLPQVDVFNMTKLMTKEVDLQDLSVILKMMAGVANSTLNNANVQEMLLDPSEEFDVIIAEWMYNEIYSGFASVYGCPLIWSSSLEPHHMVLSLIDEVPNMAYTADVFSSDVPPFSFLQRAQKLWEFVSTKAHRWIFSQMENAIYEKGFKNAITKRGRVWSPLSEAKYIGSLMLGNSHVSLGQAIRLPQNYIPIAGYHIEDKINPLPKDLQKLMDESEHGVIYFSMGSMLQSSKLPVSLKKELLDVFGSLKQTILWKFEEQLPNRPNNVQIVQWAPQQSILAHPKCVLFITHGGLLSTTETIYNGVPIIGIPMFADQFNNVERAVKKGFAIRINLDLQTPVNLKAAISEMLSNARYKIKAKELSLIYHDRPVPPGRELVHWVEHVIKTHGALHLRSPALSVPWYQKLYLDLLVTFSGILLLIAKTAKILFGLKQKTNKKKIS